jgi:hypothetical protein
VLRVLPAVAALTLLVGCDTLGGDPFADDLYSVYDLTARDGDAVVASGRIGLEYVPSDVSSIPSLWRGVWDLDAEGALADRADGRGALRGDSGEPIVLDAYFDLPERGLGPPERPAPFRLVVDAGQDPAELTGRWEALYDGAVTASGPFEATLVRAATRFHVAG